MRGEIVPVQQQLTLDDLAVEIRHESELAHMAWDAAVEHAIRAGELLIEAKARVAHGEWLPWLAANFDFTRQTSWEYMRIAIKCREDPTFAPVSVAAALAEATTGIDRKVKEIAREAQRETNRELVKQAPRLADLDETFPTIMLDPPWDWNDEDPGTKEGQFGRGTPTYATMPIGEIADQPIGELAEPDAHLYLWITNRSLPKGFALLDRWGFRYITTLTWVKPSFGMGTYFRGSTEHILFGVRGSLPLLRNDVGTHLAAPRRDQHSDKPDEAYELVETCSPGPWLEWPARRRRGGWVTVGAEI